MSLNGKGKRRLHIRTVTGKYKILKKMTKENCVLEYHTNMEFGNKRSLDGLKKNLRFMMKQRKTELQRKKQKMRRAVSKDLDKACDKWLFSARHQTLPVNGRMLKYLIVCFFCLYLHFQDD